MLGAKYIFSNWEGEITSINSELLLTLDMDKTTIVEQAIYRADYLMMIGTIIFISAIIGVSAYIYMTRIRLRYTESSKD